MMRARQHSRAENQGHCRTQSSLGLGESKPCNGYELRVLGTRRRFQVRGPLFTVGSGGANSLVLEDRFASKHHCTLLPQQDGLWIQDEGSRNGTFVNNIRVERCRIMSGTRIVVGRTSLQLRGKPPPAVAHGFVGRHPRMLKVFDFIDRVGPSPHSVLIVGETGTGKELVARALHNASTGRNRAFVPLNCAAIPRGLAESELFGHAEGAFTGARHERKGAFERADGGTLFLDEVGEMPAELQPKLLRVLEDGVVQRVGDEQPRPVEVRLIAATHRVLKKEALGGCFRLDLYHRLAVLEVSLPPLRDRREDIPLLVRFFLEQEAVKKGLGYIPNAAEDVVARLQRRVWPGNVRELRHAVERAVLAGQPDLAIEHFGQGETASQPPRSNDTVEFRNRLFRTIQREIYLKVLDEYGGNRTAAAAALGIPKSTFFDQLKALKIQPPRGLDPR